MSKKRSLKVMNSYSAGIDIGAEFHVVAIPKDLSNESVKTFSSFTGDLHEMAKWLKSHRITTAAMESTGIYWIPAFEILQQYGIEVYLVNARLVKNVPGRKTDVNDAQWLQQLHQFGLLRGSFQPDEAMACLRAVIRHRERLLEYGSAHIQHMQKALMQMNLQLHHVVTDITGVTGLKIIRAILGGERAPDKLASLRDVRCKSSFETIKASLEGNYRTEHLLALRQALELWEFYQSKVTECDNEIESQLTKLQKADAGKADLPKRRHSKIQNNEPKFNLREKMFQILGFDLTQIQGFGAYTVLKLVGECGTDLSKWPTSKHFTSWLTLSPGNKISGGKVLSSHTRKSKNRASVLLRLCAINVGKTNSALGAFYRRLGARAGKAKAVTATARKLAVIFYNAVRYGIQYVEKGAEYYESEYQRRMLNNLSKRAKELGFALVKPEAAGVS